MRTCSCKGGLPLYKHVKGHQLGHVQQHKLASAHCLVRLPQPCIRKLLLRPALMPLMHERFMHMYISLPDAT